VRAPRPTLKWALKLWARSRMRMPRTGHPRTALRVPRAFVTHINTRMKLFFASATHAGLIRVCEQIRMTLKTPCRPSTSLQRLIRLDRVNRRDIRPLEELVSIQNTRQT
jgi:hypothetical protein